MNKYAALLLSTTVLTVQSTTLQAAVTTVSFGTELMNGDSTYQIGGNCEPIKCPFNDRFPISELEFPMDMLLVTAQMQGTLDNFNFDLQFKKSIISTAAKFKDSDWTQNVNPTQLDAYSESDSTVDAIIIDASIDFKFTPLLMSNNNFLGVGYIKQNLYFDARDAVQEFPSRPDLQSFTIPGLVLTYQVDYNILYLYYRAIYNINNNTSFNIKLGYSPSVAITDIDNHVLRDRITYGNLNGTANIANLSLNYKLNSDSKIILSYRYMGVDASGKETQTITGITFNTIDKKITSSQQSLAVQYNFRF